MHIDDFDYCLPQELIAQSPPEERGTSRLLVVDRESHNRYELPFYKVVDLLEEGDCLVLNNSRVIPARLFGIKANTGARVEFLLSKPLGQDLWESLVRPGKKARLGDVFDFGLGLSCEVVDYGQEGSRHIRFDYKGDLMEVLDSVGRMPLPPYIEREVREEDRDRYQTVYSEILGSVAAPTAGLHFTKDIISRLEAKGVSLAYVTLHVGIGTFRPVKTENIEEHHMHSESFYISEEAARIINETKKRGKRVVAVGTTSCRSLESAAELVDGRFQLRAGSGETDIFIYPGYEFKMVDSLITNFHLPKSTLLMLVSSLYTREGILDTYRYAIEKEFKFFSYGDAMMLI